MQQKNFSALNTEVESSTSVTSSTTRKPRIPPPVMGVQYNFCKNPKCENFGIPPEQDSQRGKLGRYSLTSGGKHMPLLKCNSCGETPPMKSNKGIVDEVFRIAEYLQTDEVCCPNPECENHRVPLGTKKAYRYFGVARSGAVRHQCCKCKKTFSIPKPTQYQHTTSINRDIFMHLVNKSALSRIADMYGVEWKTLYNRIDFIHAQCMKFVGNRERKLRDMPIEKLYLAVDKQEYSINWSDRKDKRNVKLMAMTSSDNTTGYVFGSHLNFDYSVNPKDIEDEVAANGDSELAAPFRHHARYWIEADHLKSVLESSKKTKAIPESSELQDFIEAKYQNMTSRDDMETMDEHVEATRLPKNGVQVHAEYTMIAHFYFLKSLMQNVEKWRFFMDQESGIRSAFLSAFKSEIQDHTAEGFYIRITKETTQEQKLSFLNQAEYELAEMKEKLGAEIAEKLGKSVNDLTDQDVELELLKREIANARELGTFKDKWVKHPLPSMFEPEKAMCWLTEHDEFDEDHVAWLYNKASLYSVDSYFNKIRRRVYMCERPLHTPGNKGRVWSAYQSYKPEVLMKLIEIFRVVHNYIDVREDSEASEAMKEKLSNWKPEVDENGKRKRRPSAKVYVTPAMLLGLADAPVTYEDILYYQ